MKKLVTGLLMLTCLAVALPAPLLAAGSGVAVEQSAKVSLNEATVANLQSIPGIGKVTAERIVAYRTANGPFTSVDDLIKVKGVGSKTLDKIRPMLAL